MSMTRRTFPDSAIWANNAAEIDDPDAGLYETAYESGAGKTPPKAGVHNYLFKRADEMLQHIEQNGVPVWDARTIYALRGWCLGSDGMLYRSRQAGNVNHDPVGGDGTYWRSMTSISMEKMFPVGSAVMRPTDPGAAESAGGLGFGTWVDMQGRSPIGAGSYTDGNGDGKSFSAGSSYGEYNHTLTEDEMPKHGHPFRTGRGNDNTDAVGGLAMDSNNAQENWPGYTGPLSGARGEQIGGSGGDQSHNNLQPVFAVKIWYRSA